MATPHAIACMQRRNGRKELGRTALPHTLQLITINGDTKINGILLLKKRQDAVEA